jgi:hypothetical protein
LIKRNNQEVFAMDGFRVTLVGFTAQEATEVKQALCEKQGRIRVEVAMAPNADSTVFPLKIVHGIVFTPQSLIQTRAAGVKTVRHAMQPGTCRVYLFIPEGVEAPHENSPLDDFVQRTARHDSSMVAATIVNFFEEASDLNRRSTILALRDRACLLAHAPLGLLWPVSYVFAALHIINSIGTAFRHPFWPAFLNIDPLAAVIDFLSLYFVLHCIHVLLRNSLFGLRIRRSFDLRFIIIAVADCAAIIGVLYSMEVLGHIRTASLALIAFAVVLQYFYLFTHRICTECTSLSGLHDRISDPASREQVLDNIGNNRLTTYTFPVLRHHQQDVFISYMHNSGWSSEKARTIYDFFRNTGRKTFLDSSTIPAGALWRKHLLASVSECGYFIAVLDGEVATTDWVLAESAYAALLRKKLGKPNIILVIKNAYSLEVLLHGEFGMIYKDVFQLPLSSQYGVAIVGSSRDEFSAQVLFEAMKNIRSASLLG